MKCLPLATALLALMCSPVWAVNKCIDPDGKVVYQDAACAFKGKEINVQPNSGVQLTTPKPRASESSPFAVDAGVPTGFTPSPVPVQSGPQVGLPPQPPSPFAYEAEICLNWYRTKLRDPARAYYSKPSKEGRVLSMKVHATNGYGGYENWDAACEIQGGKLDEGWTKIHAQRRGWPEN